MRKMQCFLKSRCVTWHLRKGSCGTSHERPAAGFRRAPGSSARAVHCARSQLNTPGAAQRGARHELDFRRASEFRPLSMADAGLGFVSLGKAE